MDESIELKSDDDNFLWLVKRNLLWIHSMWWNTKQDFYTTVLKNLEEKASVIERIRVECYIDDNEPAYSSLFVWDFIVRNKTTLIFPATIFARFNS